MSGVVRPEEARTPEETAFDNFLDLGMIALRASQTLDETKRLLERTGRIPSPEELRIVITALNSNVHLIVEKYFPPPGENQKGYFSQHFTDPVEEIVGVVFDEDKNQSFVGTQIEYDNAVNGFYVYHASGQSRALHRIDHGTTVQMLPKEAVLDFSEVDPNLYNSG